MINHDVNWQKSRESVLVDTLTAYSSVRFVMPNLWFGVPDEMLPHVQAMHLHRRLASVGSCSTQEGWNVQVVTIEDAYITVGWRFLFRRYCWASLLALTV